MWTMGVTDFVTSFLFQIYKDFINLTEVILTED